MLELGSRIWFLDGRSHSQSSLHGENRLLTILQPNVEVAPTISAFFVLGAQGNDGSVPPSRIGGPRADSEYLSDDVIYPHSCFLGPLRKIFVDDKESKSTFVSVSFETLRRRNSKALNCPMVMSMDVVEVMHNR
jgi:hypothetical protein